MVRRAFRVAASAILALTALAPMAPGVAAASTDLGAQSSVVKATHFGPTQAPSGGDWPQFRSDAAHSGYNAAETTISVTNVADLSLAWTGTTGSWIASSPAVANGVVYIGSDDGKLYAYAVGCSAGGGTCTPLWTAAIGGNIFSPPSVANGVVYVGSDKLYAYAVGCASGGASCTPLWTGTTGGAVSSSPAIANGVVFVSSEDGKLYSFDATGVTGCSAGVCTPLWTGPTSSPFIWSSPAVANGVVYVGSDDGKLYAFDAAGVTGCSVGVCTPLWTATAGGEVSSSPAVANGVVYVGSWDGKLYAFDAAGVTGCSVGVCTPLWTGATGDVIHSSPAVANGVVYVGSHDDNLYAFAVGCASGGGTCTPLWTGITSGAINSSPAVANGVVYVGSDTGGLFAFGVGCATGGGSCTPLWTGDTGGSTYSSPAVANGVVYIGSYDYRLHAYDLPGPLPQPSTASCTPGSITTTTSVSYSQTVECTFTPGAGATFNGWTGLHFAPAATSNTSATFTANQGGVGSITANYTDATGHRRIDFAYFISVVEPTLALPWRSNSAPQWYFTGGPHCDLDVPFGAACLPGEVRYAVDFAPPDAPNCAVSKQWVTPAAPGVVRFVDNALVQVDNGHGFGTGYLHLASIQVKAGDKVTTTTHLGHPSCNVEPGGSSTGSHLHFYVCYEPPGSGYCHADAKSETSMPIAGTVLSGWTVQALDGNYYGRLTNGTITITYDGGAATAIPSAKKNGKTK